MAIHNFVHMCIRKLEKYTSRYYASQVTYPSPQNISTEFLVSSRPYLNDLHKWKIRAPFKKNEIYLKCQFSLKIKYFPLQTLYKRQALTAHKIYRNVGNFHLGD